MTVSLEKAGLRPNPNPTSQGRRHCLLTQAWCQRLQNKETKQGFLEPVVEVL